MSTQLSSVLTYCEQKTLTSSGTLNNNTNGLSFSNDALLDFRTELIKHGIDGVGLVEAYVPSVSAATPPTASIFAFPSDMYFLKTIEVNMTDTTQENYIQAQQVDVSNTNNQVSFDWLRVNQPIEAPLFDSRGDTYEIFPSFLPSFNLTNPIKIIYFQQPTPYASTSAVLSYPETLDQYILSDKIVSLYYESLNKFDEAELWDKKYKARVQKLINTIGRGTQQESPSNGIYDTGWNY